MTSAPSSLRITLPRIYPLTDTRISGLSHLEQVRRLIDGGATFIQLRDKTAPAGEFYAAAMQVIEYARRHDVKIIINDRVDIAVAVGADGVHLGQDDLDPTSARRILGDEKIIGYSTHSVAQARVALELPVDYLAIGPIFGTSTKADHEPSVGLEGIRDVRAIAHSIPLVAIGGIDTSTLASVIDAGADSAAIISHILSGPEQITSRMSALLVTRK